jgi:hypothetical protein
MVMSKKPDIFQQASMFSVWYANQLNQQMQEAVLKKQDQIKHGEFKFSSWDTFWQLYNRLDNANRHRELLYHVLLNYNPKWNEGKD